MNNGDYEERVARRRAYSESYHGEVKRILAAHLLIESPADIDRHEASDLIFRISGRGDVAVRIRHWTHRAQYGHQFTIRATNQNYRKTEIDKIIDGKATWFFYGFGCPDGAHIDPWVLLDLNAFRAALFRGQIRAAEIRPNFDGTSFEAYNLDGLRSVQDRPVIIGYSDSLAGLMRTGDMPSFPDNEAGA